MTACQSEKEENYIAEEVQIYFDRFQAEAASREAAIDWEAYDLDAFITNIEETGVLGQCRTYSDGSKELVVDDQFWVNASDIEKEKVVFHELGHCALGLEHNDEADAQGRCLSLMTAGTGNCRLIYNTNTRATFLDRLFEE